MTAVFIISAPSGSGKSTLVRNLLARDSNLIFSVSYTTRAPRGIEIPGRDYIYISRDEFESRIAAGEFLEWADVFGNYYGTHRSVLEQASSEGKDLILDIDVQGARQLKQAISDAVSIFVLAPSRFVLEQRLRNRSEDSDAVIQKRLRKAAGEIENYGMYDYVIINDELEKSTETLVGVIRAERVRRSRVEHAVREILESFNSE